MTKMELEQLQNKAREIRSWVIEMSRERGGFAGQGLALADLVSILYNDELDRNGLGQDRFVLSVGHNAMAIYAALADRGIYEYDELRTYAAEGSRIEQVPLEDTPGFEITNGSLGQGPSQSAGMALGYKRQKNSGRIYCLCSDGELQEGNVWEAVMFAAHYKLDNLCLIIDDNNLQADGLTDDVMRVRPILPKFEAFGWEGAVVQGDDYVGIQAALAKARATVGRPFVLVLQTELCSGVPILGAYREAHFIRAPEVVWEAAQKQLAGEELSEELIAAVREATESKDDDPLA